MSDIYILAIESSCDDTSASVLHNGKILSNMVTAQSVHIKWGGVVPELASRAHLQQIVPVVNAALVEAKITASQLSAVAFTAGPGLIGSLMVGVTFAKSFALALDIPLIQVNHLTAHVMAHLIDEPIPTFPFLCLLVSGGHTQILKVSAPLEMELIGQTLDDAAGEAFDKTAKILGLPYPGGPLIDQLAQEGDASRFLFSRSKVGGYDFSYSGLKTSVLYALKKETDKDLNFINDHLHDICAGIQGAIIDSLMQKLKQASFDLGINQIAIAGGVAANSGLRTRLMLEAEMNDWSIYVPDFKYCTDNAAMIAITAWHQFLANDFSNHEVVSFARS
jgi:N6-L-threonylcarbamoyladenine synthase